MNASQEASYELFTSLSLFFYDNLFYIPEILDFEIFFNLLESLTN